MPVPTRRTLMSPTRRTPHAQAGEARIIEAHDLAGPDGEDEIEATDDRERRWYHLRPKPRRRTDLWGFNSTWWMVLGWPLLIVFAFLRGRGGDMSALKTTADAAGAPGTTDRARPGPGAARPGHGLRRRHGRIRRARRLPRPRSERRDRAGAVHRRVRDASSASTSPPPRAASNSRSDSCSGWACCSAWRSRPSSPTTPTPTHPLCGRRPEPPRRSSPRCGAYGYATRRDLSSWGRTLFWALAGPDRLRDRRDLRLDPQRATSSTPSPASGSSARSRSSTSTACAAAPPMPPCRSPPRSSSTSSTSSCSRSACSAAAGATDTRTSDQGDAR